MGAQCYYMVAGVFTPAGQLTDNQLLYALFITMRNIESLTVLRAPQEAIPEAQYADLLREATERRIMSQFEQVKPEIERLESLYGNMPDWGLTGIYHKCLHETTEESGREMCSVHKYMAYRGCMPEGDDDEVAATGVLSDV